MAAHHRRLLPLDANSGPHAGLLMPQKDDGPQAGERRADEGEGTADDHDSAAHQGTPQSDSQVSKALAKLTATAARAGCTLCQSADGRYLLCRWNLQRELPDLHAVAALLRQMGMQP